MKSLNIFFLSLILLIIWFITNELFRDGNSEITKSMPYLYGSILPFFNKGRFIIAFRQNSRLKRLLTSLGAFFIRVIKRPTPKNYNSDIYKLLICTSPGFGHVFNVVKSIPEKNIICPECLKPWLK